VRDDRRGLPHRGEALLHEKRLLRGLELGGARANALLERGGQLTDTREVFLVLRVAPPETFLKVDESAGKLTELVRTGPGAVEGGRDRCGL